MPGQLTKSSPARNRALKYFFIAGTIVWAIYCAVLWPMHLQSRDRSQARKTYENSLQSCQDDLDPLPKSQCYSAAQRYLQTEMDSAAATRFWIWDRDLWQFMLPAILAPPILLYLLVSVTLSIIRNS